MSKTDGESTQTSSRRGFEVSRIVYFFMTRSVLARVQLWDACQDTRVLISPRSSENQAKNFPEVQYWKTV
jgi:hypothetical protein